MMNNLPLQYKKFWLVYTSIARELVCCTPGDQLSTIQELVERLHASRGIIQKALDRLQKKNCIDLEKRGKMGTYISAVRQKILLNEGDLGYITATMPSPLTEELISLASGICEGMGNCPVPFNFAFIHSAGKRAQALSRLSYDFMITSLSAARKLCTQYPDLVIMKTLDSCIYSPAFMLCSNKGKNAVISRGDRVVVDPAAVDHYEVTGKLCEGKSVVMIERPYFTCRAMLLSGEIDFMVTRNEQWLRDANVAAIPIEGNDSSEYILPAIVINKNNYNIANILNLFLSAPAIAEGQAAVLERRREPVIY